MHITKSALFACGILAGTLSTAHASSVSSSISYDTAGLPNTSWLVPAAATRTDPVSASVGVNDFPPISGTQPDHDYATYIDASAASGPSGMALRAVMTAGGVIQSAASWQDTISNASGTSKNYQLNLNLTDFYFEPNGLSANMTRLDFRTGFAVDVLVNGASVWRSAQTIKLNATGTTFHKEGVDLGDFGANGFGGYLLSDAHQMVNLGTFAAGQAATVTYRLSTFAFANNPDGCIGSFGCPFINAGFADHTLAGERIISAPVPEPESYAMLLGGLGLMGAVARRRRIAGK